MKSLKPQHVALLVVALLAGCVAACSATAGPDAGGGAAQADAGDVALGFGDAVTDAKVDAMLDAAADGGPETGAADAAGDAGADPGADANTGADAGELVQTCPGAPGCSCGGANDCSTGLCLDTPDGKRCARLCVDGCAENETCVPLTAIGGSPLDVCVMKWGKLCYPCNATVDCAEPGVAGSLCVDEGTLGRFCGAACQGDADCPDGYACQVAQSPEGPKSLQCVKVAADGQSVGTCPCTQAAKAAALSTNCYAEQKDLAGKVVGQCPGVRTCGPTGLGACTLVALKPEVCDGIDNDCNGSVDDGASGCDPGAQCVNGKCSAPCQPVDGGWSAWLAGTCSAQCGGGTLVSTRTCSNPPPSCGGQACAGDAQQSEPCNTQACVGDVLQKGTSIYTAAGQVVKGLVPNGTSVLLLTVWGGGGGGGYPGDGGGAGFGQVQLPVVPGDSIELRVAEGGAAGGGGGASYVFRNGQPVVVVAGGGGAGHDGCSGCNGGPTAGAGGTGGAIAGSGGSGSANNYVSTGSGGGQGASQAAPGIGGKSNNLSMFSGCTQDGVAGAAHLGGAGIGGYQCLAPSGKCQASYEKAGADCPTNGGSGGGGAGWFGGGSGAAMYTYTGGGGGGGASWAAADVTVLATEPGSGAQPGGIFPATWQSQAGMGGAGGQSNLNSKPYPGRPGEIVLAF